MKKTRRSWLFAAVMLMIALCFAFGACGGGDTVKFRFETNGGDPIAEISAAVGDEIELPVPVRNGYNFEGWYENAEFTGTAVTKVTAESDKTFYAKWSQLYQLKLELGAGQMSASSFYLSSGTDLNAFLKDHIPTLEGWQFGEWLMDGKPLSANAKMPQSDVTLTAHYKVGYTIHVWLQKTTLDGYEQAEDIVGFDYPVAQYSPECTMDGFELSAAAEQQTVRDLTEDPKNNVYTFYFDRITCSVVFNSSYPDGRDNETKAVDFVYGTSVTIPFDLFTADGYLLEGWTDRPGGEILYQSQALEGLLLNGNGGEKTDSFMIEESCVLYAIWNKGYTDLFGGEDVIFRTEDHPERVILYRCGNYYAGTYDERTDSFLFMISEDEMLEGKLFDREIFAYYDENREGIIYYRYQIGMGILQTERITLDSYNGLTYTTNADVSDGTYYFDESGNCVAEFTSGQKAGQTLTLLLGSVTVNNATQRVFELRNDDDLARGTMFRIVVADGELSYYPSAYLLTLDGYGTAILDMGTSQTSYFYISNGEIFQLLNANGSVYGIYRFMKIGSAEGYAAYNSSLDHVYVDDDGASLTLDGACNATYTDGSDSQTGYYTAIASAFGGYVVTFSTKTQDRIFYVSSSVNEAGEQYRFEEKDAAYAEYYYKDETGTYYTPLLVIENVTQASLYGYTVERVFVKVAEGAYSYNAATDRYAFKVERRLEPDGEPIPNPIDVTKVESFVYSTGVSSNYNVSVWYSVTYMDASAEEYDKQYRGESGATLTLVGGFAIYKRPDTETVMGVYAAVSGKENVIRVTAGTAYLYFEVDDEQETFMLLEKMFGRVTERLGTGVGQSSVALDFDGKGNVTLTSTPAEGEATSVEGRYEEGEPTVFGTPTYRFVPNDTEQREFSFMLLSASNRTYFTRLSDARTNFIDGNVKLELDGYSFMARYTDESGAEVTGSYIMSSENVVEFTVGTAVFYFDLKGETFTLRGTEAGTYLHFENQYINGYAYVLDGYGHLTVQDWMTEEHETIAEGTYQAEGDVWVLNYEDERGKHTVYGMLGIYRISSTAGYRVFVVEQKEVARKYINEADWTVLIPDGRGNAELYTRFGTIEHGTYVIISDELMYYVNSAGTSACIYRYDNEEGTIEQLSYSEHGYYTTDLRSLRFSRYGFMIMDGETRYYYTVGADGQITVYLQDPENSEANEYGFVTKQIGTFADTIVFEGVTYINNNGYSISFEREEATKNNYPVLVKYDENDNEIRSPLKKLVFQPSGSAEFSVTGAVSLDGMTDAVACTVVRTLIGENEYELYVTIGYYRFDIEVTYNGETGNVYRVTNMRYLRTLISDLYLNTYAIIYMFFGSSFASSYVNNLGVITVINEYNEQGEMTDNYINATFGEGEDILTTDGKLVETIDHASYTLEGNIYIATIELADGNTYKFYFAIATNRYFNVNSYILYAFTRVQTMTVDGYTVEVERIVATESNSVTVGGIWNVRLMKDGNEINSDSVYVAGGKVYYIVREREHLSSDKEGENTGKIRATVYYELVFVDKTPEAMGDEESEEETETPENRSVPMYESVTVTERKIKTVYCSDRISYVDIYEEDNAIAGFMVGNVQFFAESSVYDAASKTYTVTTTAGSVYTIEISEKDGVEQATVTLQSQA